MKTLVRKPIARSVAEEQDDTVPAPVAAAPPVMPLGPVPGLTVGHADAPAERAADRLAETAIARLRRLGNRLATSTVPPTGPWAPSALSRLPRTTTPGPAVIGRAGGPLDHVTGQAISSRLGRGSRLPEPSRLRMEAAFGTSLDHVRVHDDAVAATLNDAVSARAFTVGNDIFVGGDVAPANPGHDKVLAHEIAHVLTELGNVHRVHRWFELRKGSPYPAAPDGARKDIERLAPNSKKNNGVVQWDQDPRDPKSAYRFVDDQGQGWEAKSDKVPFLKVDWNLAAAHAVTEWYDATTRAWRKGEPPNTYRPAMPDERPTAIPGLRGFTTLGDVPVFVKRKYRSTKTSEKSSGKRGPGLRALDRAARVMMAGVEGDRAPGDPRKRTDLTPHLATGVVNGVLQVAGNTGTKLVTEADQGRADSSLRNALDLGRPVPGGAGRMRKDLLKLRALQSGDYLAAHSGDPRSRGLKDLSTALNAPVTWQNVGAAGAGAEHGEMTVLQNLHAEFELNLNPKRGQVVQRDLGGVKLACGACWLAFQAYNKFIGNKIGYNIVVSGTHGGFYDGWKPPQVIADNEPALEYVKAGLPQNARLDGGRLVLPKDVEAGPQFPDGSESEWEEVAP